ncbi:MAG: valine--tRNA ligase [Candidatus Bathyarchaeota archaeon]|nr:valine--tRNA ligase [Candidatus Bathyarchaeota archaeon]
MSNKNGKGQNKSDLLIPRIYDPVEHERRWQETWDNNQIYKFNYLDKDRPTYSIDSPPPYPSGEFHMGNALNWCYFDFVARFKRMQGFNIHFPQGWDCHGLPTEVRAETANKIKKKDLPASKFIEICIALTKDYIKKMKQSMKILGFSIDWSLEYTTMDPEYLYATQLSFIRLYKTGWVYLGEHPVNWCPRCETAIAEAEVEYVERENSILYIKFGIDEGEDIVIATTRPELLGACVAIAVNPSDKRYSNYVGRRAKIPIYGREVQILADKDVDTEFGTGVVMICTFGDKTDVRWQNRHNLPIIKIMGENGKLTEQAGKYGDLDVKECRSAIIEDLKSNNLIDRIEELSQSIGTCWRCHTPVEIISRDQWFMKTRKMLDEVLSWSNKINWIPSFAKNRMIDWAKSLDWDWVISRQRIFATPFPIWYCINCKEIIIAEEEWLPVDPRFESPKINKCPKCKGSNFIGEDSVMDTWMDSSITCAFHAGWPSNMDSFKHLFPADLQPNGYDIIRTWDYYLMVKHIALFGKAPYKNVLVNGMVRGADGRMMHKSYGNYVEASEAVNKYGADSLRQWAAGGAATGYDLPFNWDDVEYGKKFLTKLWNASRFVEMHIQDYEEKNVRLELLDRWILSKLNRLINEVTKDYETFQFNRALDSVRNFTWHIFCDQYIESIKYRLYSNEAMESKAAARYVLYNLVLNIIKLLAPICPHITESVFKLIIKKDDSEGIHKSKWPSVKTELIDEAMEKDGDLIQAIISEIRRIKSEKRISLRKPLYEVVINTNEELSDIIERNAEAIEETCHIENFQIEPKINTEVGRPLKDYPEIYLSIRN